MGILLMLTVAACYTYTTTSDKRAIATHHLSVNTFTFIMCASLSVLLIFTLPFSKHVFVLSPVTFLGIVLMAACKILEFTMSVLVLREMSAFEVKAWLGITLFASYFTDVVFGARFVWLKLGAIALSVLGLVLIVSSRKRERINYKRIALPLVLYLLSKYGYALIMRAFSSYVSSDLLLFFGVLMVALVYAPFVDYSEFSKSRRGCVSVALARIPNLVGALAENAVIAISMTSYSFIQPLILVSLFFIRVVNKERFEGKNLLGSILCIVGVVGFQLL